MLPLCIGSDDGKELVHAHHICTYVHAAVFGSDDGKELVHAHTHMLRTCCRCVLVVMMGKS